LVMPPIRKPTKKDDSLKRGTRYSGGSSYRKDSYGHKEPQWTTQIHQKLPKKLPDDVLAAAKKMFFELDRDNSGSIDADELGVMLRSLGQNPTDEELRALIASVDGADGGESDGQIQLREFLRLYSDAVDNDGKKVNKVDRSDVYNVFQTFGGQIADPKSTVEGSAVADKLMEEFGLECDLSATFGVNCDTMSKEDVAKLLDVEL